MFFTKPYISGMKEYNKTHENVSLHYYHAKFKMGAMKSLMLSYLSQYLIFSPNYIFSISMNTMKHVLLVDVA